MNVPEPRSVLIATLAMTTASGTVTYTRDLALALLRRGWTPIVYASTLGPQADVLRRGTVSVITDPAQLGAPPDIIHGHHMLETLSAMARFPGVPALFVCHDSLSWHSIPPRMPGLRAYVAVDRNCRDRMAFESGIPAESIRVLANPVDLERFRRREPLPPKPRRALVFSNLALENTFVAPIRAACAERGIAVDVIGLGAGHAVDHPEEELARYDLVFGKARCALEAAASGAAVIVCDARGMAGMLTSERVEALRLLNLGARTLQLPVTRENLLREIDRYDAADAAAVTDHLRASNGSDVIAGQFVELYDEILSEPARAAAEENLQAIAANLTRMAHHLCGQMAANNARHNVLLKVLNSRVLGAPLRLAWRWKKRLQAQ